MLATFLFTLVCTLALAAVMVVIRYRIETLLDGRAHFAEPVNVMGAEPEPSS
jgi:hypothetical protein